MDAVKPIAAALALIVSEPVGAQEVERWRAHIDEASVRFGLPAAWIERVIAAESGGRTTLNGRPITSQAGAMGLMQLMPGTWADMRARFGLGHDPHVPRDNILAGSLYLRLMYDRFGYPGLFGAYNAGPARYAEHLAAGRALPGESRAYLALVGKAPASTPAWAATRAASPIFFALGRGAATAGQGPPAERSQAEQELFVSLRARQRQGGDR